MNQIVWIYQRGEKHDEYYTKAIEQASHTEKIREAVETDRVEVDKDAVVNEFEPLSVILPNYHTNSLHSNIRPGSIILFP